MDKPSRDYKAHVLVLPYPAQGHINPMLQFAKRLVARGLKATLANTVHISKSMHPDPNSPIEIDTISDGFDDEGFSSAKSVEDYLETFQVVGSQTLTSLIERLGQTGHPVDALIYDGFLPWALDVAKKFGIISAVFLTQSCAVNTIYYHVHKGLVQLPLPSTSPVLVPGLPPLDPSETPSFVHDNESYPAFSHLIINQFKDVDEVDWVLVNSFYELEKEVIDWMAKLWRVKTIGPTIPSMYLDKLLKNDTHYGINLFEPKTSASLTWLNSKPPRSVVYVSFGSMAVLERDQMDEIAWGLKESDSNFLWVVRASEESKLPENFVKDSADKGLIVTWSPQLEVLEHESLGCFVTHCGYNSILEALSFGVPVISVPQWTDQPTNAKYVEDVWEIGVRAKKDEKGVVRRETLAQCIREVMVGEKGKQIRENSIKWRNLAIEAVSEGGSSDKDIDEFVTEVARV